MHDADISWASGPPHTGMQDAGRGVAGPTAALLRLRASLVLIASERPLYPIVFPHGFPMLVIPPDRNML